MDIYVFSDESGVFDKKHNDYYVFGGLMYFSKEQKDGASRKYLDAEKAVRLSEGIPRDTEIKATLVSNALRGRLFRSLNQAEKFGIVIKQKEVLDSVFSEKKSKQRYLDWAYKMAVRHKLEELIRNGAINPDEIRRLYFFVDEHTTATNGRYELKESPEQEFKIGVYNFKTMSFYPPLFPKMLSVDVQFRDSKTVTLIRAADIVANRLYHMAIQQDFSGCDNRHFSVISHPTLRTIK